ncbi:hypothetical protein VP01_1808g1 [Puccinia sorghi]|uniref:Uncharacterized protein n=1 Tax=Puccinia sorghi TaxID=27349 RepID=A0A0L6VEA0_9BASI|nr:hypothetical protein VP01_1808g1 [Puccinia sorghi]
MRKQVRFPQQLRRDASVGNGYYAYVFIQILKLCKYTQASELIQVIISPRQLNHSILHMCGFVWSKADNGLKPIVYKNFQCNLPTTSIKSRPRASHPHQLLYPLFCSPNPTTLPMDANMIAELQANLAQRDQMIHQLLQRVEAMELRANPTRDHANNPNNAAQMPNTNQPTKTGRRKNQQRKKLTNLLWLHPS